MSDAADAGTAAPSAEAAVPRPVPQVRLLTDSDTPRMLLTLVAAFVEDPISVYLWRQDEYRVAAGATLFAFFWRQLFCHHRSSYCTVDVRAVALWQPPGGAGLPMSASLRLATSAASIFGWTGIARALRVASAVDAAHPKEPHYYLGFLATDPAFQGRGYASAVMQPVLARADAEGMPCYLENSNPANSSMYHRFGFQSHGLIDLKDPAAPPLEAMWRPPRRQQHQQQQQQ